MKYLRVISVIFCLALSGCSKQLGYQMMVTSAQSCGVVISYPDGYWDLESLTITHDENSDALVAFHPMSMDINGENRKCIELDIPRPNQRELQWSDDRLSAKGHSTLTFRSNQESRTLRFHYSLHFSESKELYGGSSMYVSAVSAGGNRKERESHPFNEKFVIEITELVAE